jgi:hypothetical protein
MNKKQANKKYTLTLKEVNHRKIIINKLKTRTKPS